MRYFVSNTSLPLKYVSSGNLISKDGFVHPRRILDTYVLLLVKEGTLCITQSNVNYEVQPNQYIFLAAGEEHAGFRASSGKLSYLWVHFTLPEPADIIREEKLIFEKMLQAEKTQQGEKILQGNEMPTEDNMYIMPEYGEISFVRKVSLLFNQLLDLSRHEQTYTKYIADYALSSLVMEISQEFFDTYNKDEQNLSPCVAKVMAWIRANYLQPLTVSSIAGEFGYNADYLSTLFKKSVHISLVQFIIKTRIDISKSLMVTYDISVKETAYSCGFSDEKYFMKTFRKLENMTPTQYKKAFSKKMIN